MPTIPELPAAAQVTAADQIPISQAGSACSVNVGTLLAGTQPAIMIPTGNLLGRTSLGPGGPDPVAIGIGLLLNTTTLVATGADHAGFPLAGTLMPSDQAVLCSQGSPKLLPLSLLRGLFSPGTNIAIDQSGTISAAGSGGAAGGTAGYSIGALSPVTMISTNDLVAINQAGTDHTIPYGDLIGGQTIDQIQIAAAASDTDTLLVGQGGSTVTRQTFSAIWTWLNSKLASYQLPTVELTANTTLAAAAHNGRLLVCSQPLALTAVPSGLGSGFACTLINLSSGGITFNTGIATSSGATTLGPGQAADIACVSFSGGTIVYAWTSGVATSSSVPGQVGGLTTGATTATSMALSWTALSPPPSSYTVQYRVTGASGWSAAPSVTSPNCTVAGLLSATSYDFIVTASNAAGTGSLSAVVTAVTSAGLTPPGPVTGLTASNPTTTGLSLAWSMPTTGGAAGSYTVQYRVSGTTPWSSAASGLTATSSVVTGLSPSTSYDFEVLAVNAAGAGPASAVVTATTSAAGNSVTSVTWNIVPSGNYSHGSGAIGVNAQITPANAPVQFGFSTSSTVRPNNWTPGTYVNTNLWGAYVNTPSTAGTWYAWVEGTDGSSPTVYPNGFSVT